MPIIVGLRVHKGLQTIAAEAVQHGKTEQSGASNKADRQQVTLARAGQEEHRKTCEADNQGGPEVRFSLDEQDKQADDHQWRQQAVRESPDVDLTAVGAACQEAGQVDNDGEFGKLRWLELRGAVAYPPGRAVLVDTNTRNPDGD